MVIKMRQLLLILACAVSASCASNPQDSDPLPNEPVSLQLPRVEPSLKGVKYSLLLDFENQRDMIFMNTPDSGSDETHRHTGFRSLQLGAGMKSTIKLSSLMMGRPFPGDYTLLGGYLRSERAANVTMRCNLDGYAPLERSMIVAGSEWKALLLDLTELVPTKKNANGVAILEIQTDAPVYLDDVLIIDNTREFIPPSEGGWSIVQRGFKIKVDRPSMFQLSLNSAQGKVDGWEVEETSPVRARFSMPGTSKSLTVYNDGRSFWDGAFKPLSAATRDDKAYATQHSSPARIAVPEDLGRIIRNSPGDANADGYNESRGCYTIRAATPRLQIEIASGATPVTRPVFEITGLPEGKVLVNVEGQIVDAATRLPDGTVLLMLPLRFARTTQISLRVE
jgi:hypothetical protein